MKRFLIYISVFFQIFIFSRLPVFAKTPAPDPSNPIQEGAKASADAAGLQSFAISAIIGRLIQIALGLTGIILMVVTVYAGILYLTAMGDAAKVEKAKKMITQAVIGIILIVGAYSIATFIIGQLNF